ncbi:MULTISPECIES: DUF3316 domain-containing protein [Dysgonomonas]|uniref:DUF3316 domain-containing protein n=1 Tax=Dysgonomonas TaxID=156973 RepID=UPI0009269318|nr:MULTISPECIES: DUF3316 domain-containing protein [Dysgonomonas]MBN9301857.1 DUF3316 domain-containing protein [Dysgonomonas mossii]OJX58430.1 MAG: hypothetical protein BGO84_05165 [Dysgonomonas sp. 37-18]
MMIRRRKNKYIFLLFLSVCVFINLQAQNLVDKTHALDSVEIEGYAPQKRTIVIDDSSLGVPIPLRTNNTLSVSIGSANMYDTYLSPLEYKGFSIHLMYEQMRRTTWFDYKFYKQQIFEVDLSKGDNPAKNVSEYWALLSYRIGGHYMVYNTDNFRVGLGGLWDINGGVLYNERNGNNPASARAYSNLNLSVTASYKFKWGAVRWQIDSPFIGILFSPKYGQSYYEISLGNSVGLVNFASYHNQRALRNYISMDIPINKYTIRVGYMGSWYQTKVNEIQTHQYTNSFVIGFPIEGVKKPKEKARIDYWNGK